MTNRPSRFLLPRTRCLRLAAFVAVWTLFSIGTHGVGTVAWGQGDRLHSAVTEIWMSGENLAVTRRIPQDRRSAQHAYDEVARSMVNIAESEYRDLDKETVEWLRRWALELTDGRVGNSPRTGSRQWQPHAPAVPTIARPQPLASESLSSSIPAFDPAKLAIEWPISAFADKSTPAKTQPSTHKSELSRDLQRRESELVLVAEHTAKGEQLAEGEARRTGTRPESYESPAAATQAQPAMQTERRTGLDVKAPENLLDDARRQIALVPTNRQPGGAGQLEHAAPASPTEQGTSFALGCFAAGVVCCFVLHTLLLLTPVRLAVGRPSSPASRTLPDSSAVVMRTDEPAEPARRASEPTRPPTATRGVAAAQDKASSMVEEFYNSNIELFEKFSQSVD